LYICILYIYIISVVLYIYIHIPRGIPAFSPGHECKEGPEGFFAQQLDLGTLRSRPGGWNPGTPGMACGVEVRDGESLGNSIEIWCLMGI